MVDNGLYLVAYVRENTIEQHWVFKERGDAETKFWYEAEIVCGVEMKKSDFQHGQNLYITPSRHEDEIAPEYDRFKLNLIYPD